MIRDCADVAAKLHAHLCNCGKHGYTWDDRWGVDGDPCFVTTGDETFMLKDGDRDCSSSVCDAWQEAIRGTAFEGALDAATYTGNMKTVFLQSGLFEWMPMSFTAQRGDVYLNEANHTAMCQSPDPDMLSEFCSNEFGGCYGGEQGDQTGGESHIADYYSYPWDGILHYNGAADGEDGCAPTAEQDSPSVQLLYNVMAGGEWLDTMSELVDTGGSGDDYAGLLGQPMEYLSMDALRYRVRTEDGGWLDWVCGRNLEDLVNGAAGDGSPILQVEVADDDIGYEVHALGGDWMDGRTADICVLDGFRAWLL